jgi:UDP-N-acetylmuramate dehydrogenase
LGEGSNILFRSHFPGVALINNMKWISIVSETDEYVEIKALSGEVWHDLVMWTVNQWWSGLENLALIPGTVGAAPLQNIWAYGSEVKDVISFVEAIRVDSGEYLSLSNAECEFWYRDSIFKNKLKDRCIITAVGFRLSKNTLAHNTTYQGVSEMIQQLFPGNKGITPLQCAQAVIALRKSKLPDRKVLWTAWSFFKNPIVSEHIYEKLKETFPLLPCYPTTPGYVKLSAWWLIEQCGLKWWRVWDAGVYEKHALVLVNHGNATGEEIWACAEHIMKTVYEKFGIRIEPEVNCI